MAERTLLAESIGKVTYLEKDASEKKHRIMEVFRDNGVLAENARIRNSPIVEGSMKRQIMDNQKIEYWFRIPNLEVFKEFKRLHPRVMEDIESPDESTRMKGARAMSLLQPRWVIFNR